MKIVVIRGLLATGVFALALLALENAWAYLVMFALGVAPASRLAAIEGIACALGASFLTWRLLCSFKIQRH